MMLGDMPCNAPAPTPDATGARPAGAAAMYYFMAEAVI